MAQGARSYTTLRPEEVERVKDEIVDILREREKERSGEVPAVTMAIGLYNIWSS